MLNTHFCACEKSPKSLFAFPPEKNQHFYCILCSTVHIAKLLFTKWNSMKPSDPVGDKLTIPTKNLYRWGGVVVGIRVSNVAVLIYYLFVYCTYGYKLSFLPDKDRWREKSAKSPLASATGNADFAARVSSRPPVKISCAHGYIF